MFASVIVDISNSNVDKIFDYSISTHAVKKGHRVLVPFGSQTVEGYVVDLKEETTYERVKVKDIISVIDDNPVITEELFLLSHEMRRKYNLRFVDVLRLFIPSQMRQGRVKELKKQFVSISEGFADEDPTQFIKTSAVAQFEVFAHLKKEGSVSLTEMNKLFSASALRNLISRGVVTTCDKVVKRTPYLHRTENAKNLTLTDEQEEALKKITNKVDNPYSSVPNQQFTQVFLLHGVTGSGKTEVYMRAISNALIKGKTAIMLVPEISLTPQVLSNFRAIFSDKVAILHSGLSAGERFDEWCRLRDGEALVAIGARSAIFAPLKNLGLIIIDEEHDSSYISETNPRYSTLDVAKFRAKENNCSLVLGSATPSIESFYRAKQGEYSLITMSKRVNARQMPSIDVVNMCREIYEGNTDVFSRALTHELNECMKQNNQAIVFINRRGYSSYIMCRSCGYVAKCSACDVSLVYHQEENVLKCHYCENRFTSLNKCTECSSSNIKRGFSGTQQIEEKLSKMFPNKVVLRMDNDTTQNKDAHEKILTSFKKREADIIVGTQMIAKGHDFPDVTLVGIVDADMSLHLNDFRSFERTYQLVTQVSGRAGREEKVGKVVLQTYTPRHYVYKFALSYDYEAFFEKEINLREIAKFPPFSTIMRILISSENETDAVDVLKEIFEKSKQIQSENKSDIAYLAAMRSPVKRIQNKFRMQILFRISNNFDTISQKIYELINETRAKGVTVFSEINPQNLS
ncbi:MAG: primosomal protein N' [Firmicutes bacterium]|nr:primosomal protein N' [Bacillota bacterium]MCL2255771.1 primosomal protein N' [Bacillota bacterium]